MGLMYPHSPQQKALNSEGFLLQIIFISSTLNFLVKKDMYNQLED